MERKYKHLFTGASYRSLFLKNLNSLAEDKPEMLDFLTAISMYPFIRWQVQHKEFLNWIYSVSSADCEECEILQPLLNLIKSTDHTSVSEYIKSACEFVDGIEQGILATSKYSSTLATILGRSFSTESRYKISIHLRDALSTMYQTCGEQIVESYRKVKFNSLRDSSECWSYALDCCLDALSATKDADGRPIRPISFRGRKYVPEKKETPVCMRAVADMTSQAIECLRTFPANGEALYNILMSAANFKPVGMSDDAIAEMLNISRYTYFTQKKQAKTLLVSILFAGNTESLEYLIFNRY